MYWYIAMCVVVTMSSIIAIRRNRTARSKFISQHPEGDEVFSESVKAFLDDGERIKALRQFRKETGLGLKDVKEIFDKWGG